jgi:hypothetical protein
MYRSTYRSTRISKGTIAAAAGACALAVVAGIGVGPSSAVGSTATVWTHVPSACTPDEASAGRYDVHVSSFKHAAGATGQIVTRCNVVDLPEFGSGDFPVLDVVYKDGDGTATGEQVLVDLIEARPDGSTSIMARFNSNTFSGSAATQRRFIDFTRAFNFNQNGYYVEVRVSRSSTATAPSASTVRLTRVIG